MKKFKYAYQVGGLWGDVRTRIPRIAKLGYDAVEVAGVTSYFHEGKEFKKICDSEGIAVSSVCTNCAELDMAYPRKGVRDQGIDYMCRLVDFAADLGGNGVIINPTRLTKWTLMYKTHWIWWSLPMETPRHNGAACVPAWDTPNRSD